MKNNKKHRKSRKPKKNNENQTHSIGGGHETLDPYHWGGGHGTLNPHPYMRIGVSRYFTLYTGIWVQTVHQHSI